MQEVPHFKSVSVTWLADALVHHGFIDRKLTEEKGYSGFFMRNYRTVSVLI